MTITGTEISSRATYDRARDTANRVTRSSQHQGSLRILLVSAQYLPHVGGTEIHTYEVARRLAAAGHDVTVLTTNPERKLPAQEEVSGVHIRRVPAWPPNKDYYFAPGIYSMIMQQEWDIIHCQGYHTLVAPVVMLAALRKKIPYVLTFHSGGNSSNFRNAMRPVQMNLLKPLLRRSAGLVGVSNWEAEFFGEQLHLPAGQFRVIPNGSYLPEIKNSEIDGYDGDLLVSVGRLERYKGHHRVIAALPLVAREYPRIRLRIVGSGPYESALRQLSQDMGVSERVEIGAISAGDREKMASVLKEAALVILLSEYESQSISVWEALMLGRPVLVADSTALSDLVSQGLARSISLNSTSEEISSAILKQLRQPLLPPKTDLPTWDACVEDLLELYQQVVARSSACVS